MALINCPECNNEVSNEATVCPHCGKPMPKSSSTPEQQKQNRKGCLIFLAPLLLILIIIFVALLSDSCKGSNDTIDYEIVSTSEYINNYMESKAYRVVVSSTATRSELMEVFEDITDDGYAYHTVWFYSTKSKAKGGDTYDIAMIDDDDGYNSYKER